MAENLLRTGVVTKVTTDGAWCEIPEVAPHHEFGPMETGLVELAEGDRVLVGQVSGSLEDFVVIDVLVMQHTDPLIPPFPPTNSRYILYYENETARTAAGLTLVSGLATWLDDEHRLDIYTDEGTPHWESFYGFNGSSRMLVPQGYRIGIGSATPAATIDVTNSATTDNMLSSSVVGESQPRLTVGANGLFSWGGGSGSADVTAARATGGSGLRINPKFSVAADPHNNSVIYAERDAATNRGVYVRNTASGNARSGFHTETSSASGAATPALTTIVTGDSNNRLAIAHDGAFVWGSGAAAGDTNLYRSAADTLKTDDSVIVAQNMELDGTFQFGSTASVGVEGADTSVTAGTTTSTAFVNSLTTTLIRGVTFVAPPSGKVVVVGMCNASNNPAGSASYLDFEVRAGTTIGSGTVFRASDENTASEYQTPVASYSGRHVTSGLVTGLTPGSSYNVCLTYRVSANTGSFTRRKIRVEPRMI